MNADGTGAASLGLNLQLRYNIGEINSMRKLFIECKYIYSVRMRFIDENSDATKIS